MEMNKLSGEAAFAMCLHCKLARRRESIDVFQRPAQQTGVAPQLRRPATVDRASDTGTLDAYLTVEFPQHVHRTHKPVLDQRTEFQGLPHSEDMGSAQQRDVVIVDDIESISLQDAT